MIREEQVGGSQASCWQAAVLALSCQTVQGQKRQPPGNGPSGSGLGLSIWGEGGEALSKDSHSCPPHPSPHRGHETLQDERGTGKALDYDFWEVLSG